LNGLIAFLNPGFAERQREYEERHDKSLFESAVAEGRVVNWDPLKTTFNEVLVINGRSWKPWKPWKLSNYKVKPHQQVSRENGIVSPCGKWLYMNRYFPKATPLPTAYNTKRGKVWFTKKVIIPVLFRDPDQPRVMMSITPSEIFTLRPGIRKAKGEVIIGGLGLGWMLSEVAKRKRVRKITVIEKDQGLIDWYGRANVEMIGRDTGRNIELICGDVFDHMGKFDKEAIYLLDIWEGLGNASGDPKLRKARREHGCNVWAWGENVYRD
jgi:hypothetical protein